MVTRNSPFKKERFMFAFWVWGLLFSVFFLFLLVNRECGVTAAGEIETGIHRLAPLIQLKLSAPDLVLLSNPGYAGWINVDLVGPYGKEYRVRVKRHEKAALDFQLDIQLDIDRHVFYLFTLDKKREALYTVFKKIGEGPLERSSPVQTRLNINGVSIGNYLVEEKIYEQVRDERGSYFIRWTTGTHRLRKMRYEVAMGYMETLIADFDIPRLAAGLAFFGRLGSGEAIDPGRPVFRFEPRDKKFRPYITLESLFLY